MPSDSSCNTVLFHNLFFTLSPGLSSSCSEAQVQVGSDHHRPHSYKPWVQAESSPWSIMCSSFGLATNQKLDTKTIFILCVRGSSMTSCGGVIPSSNHIRAVGIELGLWNSGQLFCPTMSACWNFRTFYRWIMCSFMCIVIVSILKNGSPEELCFCVCYAVFVYACTHPCIHMCEYTLYTCKGEINTSVLLNYSVPYILRYFLLFEPTAHFLS